MAAKAVVCVITATAFVFLFLIAVVFPLNHRHGGGGDVGVFGLNRRLGYHTTYFDPLVAEFEIQRQDNKKEGENNESASDSMISDVSETYLYLTAWGKLNTTLRLTLLFPLLDREVKDGLVSYDELEAWIRQQALERMDYLTHIEMESKDRDGDASLSFTEYFPRFSHQDIERGEMGIGEAGWWHQRFTIADIDGNGRLNFTELRDFLHPEDSNNQELVNWMFKDRLQRIGDKKDGKLNLKGFKDHLYGNYENYRAFETAGEPVPLAEHKFAELDKNNDKFLSVEELKPILHYLYPGEISYARLYTSYLMKKADDNKDWKLSLEEMLRHEKIFYSTVHVDGNQGKHHDRDEF